MMRFLPLFFDLAAEPVIPAGSGQQARAKLRVLGRGGEEREALEADGVAVTVVAGIAAALGCAAEAGLPLTLRKQATRLSIVTANTAEGAAAIDCSWKGSVELLECAA
jgi:siroheme synthase